MKNNEEVYKLTGKGVIISTLMDEGFCYEMAGKLTDLIWNKLYEHGCKDIGEIGVPAMVIEKSTGGEFIPVIRGKKE